MKDDSEAIDDFFDEVDDLASSTQICSGPCHRSLPLTDSYWHRDDTKDTGFHLWCKDCRAAANKTQKDKHVVAVAKRLDERGVALLDKVSQRIDGELFESAPHMLAVVEEMMALFGGARGYAQHVYAHFLSTEPGSAGRLKVLQMIGNMVQHVSDSGKSALPVDLLKNEDLDREIEKRLRVVNADTRAS